MPENVKVLDKKESEDTAEDQKMSLGSQNDSPIKIELEEMDDSPDVLNDRASEVDDDDQFKEGEENIMKNNDTCVDKVQSNNSTQVDCTVTVDIKEENKESDECKIVETKTSEIDKLKMNNNYMWVSNITKNTKASDLKKYFSQIGKVITAKILTNGKSFYGYVSVENPDVATQCIKRLHNSLLDGNKITVTKCRPDLKENKKRELKKKKNGKTDKKIDKDNTKLDTNIKETIQSETKVEEDKAKQAIDNLNRKLKDAYSDIARYKRKFEESHRRFDSLRRKCESLEKQLANLQTENRAERRKLNRERDDFEKAKKLEDIRIEADKAVVNKELAEVRKLRMHLKEKIEEFKNSAAKITKRVRSPVLRNVRSPLHHRSPDQNRFTFEERSDKRSKREEMPRGGRTPPPPPPKLTEPPKKRPNENHSGNRHYFPQPEKKHTPAHNYEYRHKPGFTPPLESTRNSIQVMYPKEVRRSNPFPFPSQPYNEPRYGGGYQHQSNNVSLTPRTTQGHYYSNY